ncbi:MAG TPA: GreA/GreB family elongation factor [Lentimicrobium sp.]|jgi:transcription elongation factor GreB|nr:GreA/GreB family elongation factor [Lentimicrobium sp.]
MSRAFVNEDDLRESPFVPPRADLPDGVPNYVTPSGMESLLKEKEALQLELKQLNASNEHEKQNAIAVLSTRLQMLEARIASAQVIEPEESIPETVRFGNFVTLQIGETKQYQQFQVVGVDEANLKKGKIAFTSPLARLLINRKAGETITLNLEHGSRVFKIVDIRQKN